MRNILICTVGGSPQPIINAITSLNPDFIVFICSLPNELTNNKGSATQIINPSIDPSSPTIPEQALIPPEAYEIILIPDDDLQPGIAKIREHLKLLRDKYPHDRFYANYTGGTKTMSSALVVASLNYPWVELQITTGVRLDLVKVMDGTESTRTMDTADVRVKNEIDILLSYWNSFDYGATGEGLKTLLSGTVSPNIRSAYEPVMLLSQALANWDRFRYDVALGLFRALSGKLDLNHHLETLSLITKDSPKGKAMVLFDLWYNALRRAAQQRWDDAVVRCYRLVEATAQWILATHHGINTATVPREKVPENISLSTGRNGELQAGLINAWLLIKTHHDGPAKFFIDKEISVLRNLIDIRNSSYLAHGMRPITSENWQTWHDWFRTSFMPMLIDEARRLGIRHIPDQLPSNVPSHWISN